AELEGVEGVPARRLAETRQLGASELEPEPALEELVERKGSERAEPQAHEPTGREQALAVERLGDSMPLPDGHEQPDRLRAEPPQRELERSRRGGVEPLGVVERDEERAPLGHDAKHVEHREPDRMAVWRSIPRLGDQEGDLERAPPRRKQRRSGLLEHGAEELRKTGEGKGRLRLDPAAGQDPAEAFLGFVDAGLPEDRLADPRLAREDERPRAALDAGEESSHRRELSVAA